jgi:hypothetical protein
MLRPYAAVTGEATRGLNAYRKILLSANPLEEYDDGT